MENGGKECSCLFPEEAQFCSNVVFLRKGRGVGFCQEQQHEGQTELRAKFVECACNMEWLKNWRLPMGARLSRSVTFQRKGTKER